MMKVISIVLLVVGSISIVLVMAISGYVMWEFFKSWRLKKQLYKLAFNHKMMLNGNNRFVADYDTIKKMFPEHNELTLIMAWESLVKDGVIKKDELDGEWVIK